MHHQGTGLPLLQAVHLAAQSSCLLDKARWLHEPPPMGNAPCVNRAHSCEAKALQAAKGQMKEDKQLVAIGAGSSA
jgi:hypothetical protein